MITFLFLGNLSGGEILIIALVVLLLFGGKKIPELMRGLGTGVKSFKDGMNGLDAPANEDGKKAEGKKDGKAEASKDE